MLRCAAPGALRFSSRRGGGFLRLPAMGGVRSAARTAFFASTGAPPRSAAYNLAPVFGRVVVCDALAALRATTVCCSDQSDA